MQLLEEFLEVMLNMGQAVAFNAVNRNVSKTVAARTVPQKHWYRHRFWQNLLTLLKVLFNHDPLYIILSSVSGFGHMKCCVTGEDFKLFQLNR